MKYLVRVECDRVSFIKIKKSAKALVTVNGRLYRNDDSFYIKDYLSSDAMRFQNIDSSQILSNRPVFIDQDMTRAFADSAKLSGNKRRVWLNLDGGNLWKYLAAAAVVFSLIYGFLSTM